MKHTRKVIAGLALLAVTALTPACSFALVDGQQHPTTVSGERASVPQTESTPSTGTDGTPSTGTEADTSGTQTDDTGSTGPSDSELQQLREDIESATQVTDQFWSTNWATYFTGTYTAPVVYGTYDGTHPETARTCGGEPLAVDNALYCSEGDFVAWDAGLMLRSLDVGNSWVYLVVAHEWGHAIQERLEDSLVWKAKELQADCLAGATLYGAEQGGSISLAPVAEKQLVDALNDLADETAWTGTADHGDSFQRIEAFNLGRTEGVNGCLPA